MSHGLEQRERDTAAHEPPPPQRRESPVVAEVADVDLLAGTELRTLTPEALQLLAATGC